MTKGSPKYKESGMTERPYFSSLIKHSPLFHSMSGSTSQINTYMSQTGFIKSKYSEDFPLFQQFLNKRTSPFVENRYLSYMFNKMEYTVHTMCFRIHTPNYHHYYNYVSAETNHIIIPHIIDMTNKEI